MSLVINHNLMAMNASRNMNTSYGALADSTRKLSSGLRVGQSADDAAGLAIRELMRADVATLNQGVRNANDAISLIQTADGALAVIDEKLIRMRELAEQAATGTYDSIQRAIIDSEYQQMASEITRIANATDFNGIKLLNGALSAADMNNPGASHDGSGGARAGGVVVEAVKVGAEKILQAGHVSAFRFLGDLEGNLKQHGPPNGTGFWVNNGTGSAREITTTSELKRAMKAAIAGATNGNPPSSNVLYGRKDLAENNTAVTNRWDLSEWGGADPPTNLYMDVTAFGVYKMQEAQRWLATEEAKASSWGENRTVLADVNGPFGDFQGLLHGDYYSADGTRIKQLADLDRALKAGQDIYDLDITDPPFIPPPPAGEPPNPPFNPNDNKITGHELNTLRNNVAHDVNLFAKTDEYNANIDPDLHTTLSDENGDLTRQYWRTTPGGSKIKLGTLEELEKAITSGATIWEDWGDVSGPKIEGAALAALTAAADVDMKAHAKVAAANAALDPEAIVTKTDAEGNLLEEFWIKDAGGIASIQIKTVEQLKAALDAGTTIYTHEVIVGNVHGFGPAPVTGDKLAALRRDVEAHLGESTGDNSIGPLKIHFGTGNSSAEDYYYIAIDDSRASALGVGNGAYDENGIPMAGHNISTQENAQEALNGIIDAITSKDNIRANLGALQNRLENTINNVTIQAENLQAAESRISDVDVAYEMTEFTRNQVLTNAANSMLSQANLIPQMALKLLG